MLLGGSNIAKAEALPAHLTVSELADVDADKEVIGGQFPGLLLVQHGDHKATDEKYGQPFHTACQVYIAERPAGSGETGDVTGYARRFIVHVPDTEGLALAKRVGRLLLLLHGEGHTRLRYDHPNSMSTVEVWLTQQTGPGLSADIGGEQFKNQFYLYNLYNERKPIEWMREVAHEYGHFALPGVSGFTAPEEWANGVLGERLYLKWLHDDLRAGRLHTDDLPFITREMLDEYVSRQVDPLIHRFAREGADESLMGRRNAAGMDYYTGLVLYWDEVYGSRALLDAFTYTTPPQGSVFVKATDFLHGATASLAGATDITIMPPLWTKEERAAFFVYLPRGEFQIVANGPIRSWSFPVEAKGFNPYGKNNLVVNRPGWQKLTIALTHPSETPVHLTFRRRGTEVP